MWDELPQEIIETISKKITSYADYLRFQCVCCKWRLYTPEAPPHLPTPLPCLLPCLMISHQSIFDLSTNEIHDLNLAPYCSSLTHIYGSSHGWLVIVDKPPLKLHLLNPITLATISLPKLNPHDYKNSICLIKVVLSSSPSLSDDSTAFALLHFNRFAFCRMGYDSWVVLNWGIKVHGMDAVYKNGSFFVVGTNGMIAVFNVDRREVSHIEMSPIEMAGIRRGMSHFEITGFLFANDHCNLVFFKENLLLVIRIFTYERRNLVNKTVGFKIYKMNSNVRKWEQIHSLGKHFLFIGTGSSICCCAADFVKCRPNCVYFTDYTNGTYFGIYSLSNESIEPLSGNPHRSYRDSVWVEPSPY